MNKNNSRRWEIKHGSTRTVFLIGNKAIKIPNYSCKKTFLWGLLANQQEKSFWKQLKDKRLAKVFFCDPWGFFLIMERADYTFPNYGLYKRTRIRLNKFMIDCEKNGLPIDEHYSNIGKFKNKLKLIDYGS